MPTTTTSATAKGNRKLREDVQQPSTFRVTIGGKTVDKSVLDAGDDWRKWTGEIVAEGVRVINARSVNGVEYHPGALDDIARLSEGLAVSREHEDRYAIDGVDHRPESTRKGELRNSRRTGEGVSAEWVMNEADRDVFRDVVQMVRFPNQMKLSVEIDQGQWERVDSGDLQESDGRTHVGAVHELLDVAIVARGGTTKRINESENPKRSRSARRKAAKRKRLRESQMPADNTQKLLELQGSLTTKIQECEACEKGKQEVLAELALVKSERDELQKGLAACKAKVQENDRRGQVRKLAFDANVKLTESQVGRYAKFTDEELADQLKIDGDRGKITEDDHGYVPSPSGSTPRQDVEEDEPVALF